MTVVLELKPETEEALRKKENVNGYVERLIEKDIDRLKTLDRILAPIRKNFAETGMSEGELDDLIEGERQAMWEEKQDKRG